MRRFGRLGVACAAVASATGAICYHTDLLNNPWCSSFGVLRFGRATNAVSASWRSYVATVLAQCMSECILHLKAFWVALDYKWSMRNLEWKTEEYHTTITQVSSDVGE